MVIACEIDDMLVENLEPERVKNADTARMVVFLIKLHLLKVKRRRKICMLTFPDLSATCNIVIIVDVFSVFLDFGDSLGFAGAE